MRGSSPLRINESVILAAGMGVRLRSISDGKPKFMFTLLNKPLILYPISILKKIGITKFTIVLPEGWVSKARDILRDLDVEICYVTNKYIEKDNGYSFLISEECVSNDIFFLSMCDHIYSVKLPYTMIKYVEKYDEHDVLIAGDKNAYYVDHNEATKILADESGNVIKIGKSLSNYNYIDTGVFIVKKSLFDIAHYIKNKYKVLKFSNIINEAIKHNFSVKVIDVTGSLWTEVDTPDDINEVMSGWRKVVIERVLGEINDVR